jgi:NADH-quinone oxidoreductase subunit E
MATIFSDNALMEFRSILTRYPTKRAALLPTLHLAQREFGYISSETIEYIASLLELTPAEVWNAVSFYSLFYRKAMGMYVVQVCQTLSCSLFGAQHILDHLVKKLGINPGETTPDKRFSLLKVECLGSCGTAPVMRINYDYYENLTTEKIDALLDSLS